MSREAGFESPPQGSDTRGINDPIKNVQVRQPATVLKYTSSSRPKEPTMGDVNGNMRAWQRCGPIPFAGWSDAAYGDLSKEGRRPSGYAIGLMSSSLPGPRRILQPASKLTRKLVTRNLGGGWAPPAGW